MNHNSNSKAVDLITDLVVSLKEKQGTERAETFKMISDLLDKERQSYSSAKLSELLEKLPRDDIDEELSARYDLVIPQGVHGYRTALTEVREAIEKMLEELS